MAVSATGVALVSAALVVVFDAVLEARVRAGSDNALRLSVLLPYVGVGSRYVLARAFGLAALVLSGASVGVGLELGRRRALRRSVPGILGLVHRQLSVIAIGLVAAHVVLPYTGSVTPFGGWPTSLVPFDQPYSFGTRGTIFESFGIVAFYLLVLLGPTYYLLRGHRRLWASMHGLTAGAYGLAVLHALFLGSDFVVGGATQVALIAAQLPLTVLLARRLWSSDSPLTRRVGAGLAVSLGASIVGVAAAGLAGGSLGRIPL